MPSLYIGKYLLNTIKSNVEEFDKVLEDRVISKLVEELKSGSPINLLNTIRHFKIKERCPYNDLWKHVESEVNKKYLNTKYHSKAMKVAHEIYSNSVNEVIYRRTIRILQR